MEKIKNKELLKNILKYLLFLITMVVLNFSTLNYDLQPFGFAMYFALVWCNQNILIVSLIYIISTLFLGISQTNLICAVCTVVVFLLFYFLHYKLKKPLNVWLILVYSFLSQIGFLYFNIDSVDGLVYCIAYIAVGLIFTFTTMVCFQTFMRKKFSAFSMEEYICTWLFLAVLSLGIASFSIFYINFVQIFAICVLLFLRGISPNKMLLSAIIMGLGASLNAFYLGYLIMFCCYAIIIWIFADKNPIFMILGLLLIDLFVGLYLQVLPNYHYQSLIAVVLGIAISFAVPQKFKNTLIDFLSSGEKSKLVQDVLNISTKKLNRKLLEMAEVFAELQKLYSSMSKGNLSEEEIVDTISQEIIQSSCQDCKDKSRCLRLNNRETMQQIKNLVLLGLKKGKLSLMDVDDRLTRNCIKINTLIPHVNDLILEYKRYENNLTRADSNRNIIARSLGGVSGVLQELADNIDKNITFDTQIERDLQEELVYEGIQCREIFLYEKEMDTIVALLIKNENIYKSKLTNIVTSVVGIKMMIASVIATESPGYSSVVFKVAPRYDIAYGVATKVKAGSESSGDTHSFYRIDNEKFLFALCDGMGSGANAKKASELSIGIIENLYKAGFKSETVIDCTNNLLTMASSDVFTAIDLGVINLKNGLCDIIKIGAPYGFIKKADETKIIEAGALPLGILEELHPQTSQLALEHGDNIILMTDGVFDAFEDEQVLKNYINNLGVKNPQTMADYIIDEALHRNQDAPKDDMTVFVVRMLEQN